MVVGEQLPFGVGVVGAAGAQDLVAWRQRSGGASTTRIRNDALSMPANAEASWRPVVSSI